MHVSRALPFLLEIETVLWYIEHSNRQYRGGMFVNYRTKELIAYVCKRTVVIVACGFLIYLFSLVMIGEIILRQENYGIMSAVLMAAILLALGYTVFSSIKGIIEKFGRYKVEMKKFREENGEA